MWSSCRNDRAERPWKSRAFQSGTAAAATSQLSGLILTLTLWLTTSTTSKFEGYFVRGLRVWDDTKGVPSWPSCRSHVDTTTTGDLGFLLSSRGDRIKILSWAQTFLAESPLLLLQQDKDVLSSSLFVCCCAETFLFFWSSFQLLLLLQLGTNSRDDHFSCCCFFSLPVDIYVWSVFCVRYVSTGSLRQLVGGDLQIEKRDLSLQKKAGVDFFLLFPMHLPTTTLHTAKVTCCALSVSLSPFCAVIMASQLKVDQKTTNCFASLQSVLALPF